MNVEVLLTPWFDCEKSKVLLSNPPSIPISAGDHLQQIIETVASLESARSLEIWQYLPIGKEFHVNTRNSGFVYPSQLMADPNTPLHVIKENHRAIIKSGECAVSPAFYNCIALIKFLTDQTLGISHLYRLPHKFAQERENLQALQATVGVNSATIIAREPEKFHTTLTQNQDGYENVPIGMAAVDYPDLFRVWALVEANGETAIRVTQNDPTNTLLNVLV